MAFTFIQMYFIFLNAKVTFSWTIYFTKLNELT
jgi:hypothetical protein